MITADFLITRGERRFRTTAKVHSGALSRAE
jgi:hypothetical protein